MSWRKIFFFSFSDPEHERRFLEKQNKDNLKFNRLVFCIGLFGFLQFYALLYFMLPRRTAGFLLVTGSVAAAAFILIIIISFRDLSYRVLQPAMVASLMVINAAPLVALMDYPYPETSYFYAAGAILMVASLAFLKLNFYSSLAFSASYIALFEIMYFIKTPGSPLDAVFLHQLYLYTILVGLFSNYNLDKSERINFIKLNIIVEDRLKISRMKDRKNKSVSE